MAWLWLAIAIVFEVCGTAFLKKSDGFSKLVPTLTSIGFYIVSFWLLAISLKTIDVSIAYAIWGGVGIVLVTLIAFFCFDEPISLVKALCIFLIIAGSVGLNLITTAH